MAHMERRWLVLLFSHGIGFKSNTLRSSKKNTNFSMEFNGEENGGKL
jgi:hypothetical protein